MARAEASAGRRQAAASPGEGGVWAFVIGDLLMFGILFATFLLYRQGDLAGYNAASGTLSILLGTVNTLILLTSSLFVAHAVQAARAGSLPTAKRLLELAVLCGLGFVLVKAFEWGGKLAAGINVNTHDFYMYFFMLTGIHLVHVLLGLVALFIMWELAGQKRLAAGDLRLLESGGIYWHLVDLLWIALFPLFYLLR